MLKVKDGIDRADLSRVEDELHTHSVFFERDTQRCVGVFQHPPMPEAAVDEHLAKNGHDPSLFERLWATRERWAAISQQVYAEEIAAREAQEVIDVADAKLVGAAWLQVLKAQDATITKARLANFVRWLNTADIFNGA